VIKQVFVLASMVLVVAAANAQDTRTVTEPVIPASCVVLKAELVKVGGIDGIALADEQKPDTGRLQKALDGCAQGKAVELASDGAKAAFLAGPIELRPGVTLVVDKGVTLFGSRLPQDYEVESGSCGINAPKTGCKALISGKGATGSGIMGEGVIDGRGGSKMIRDGKVEGKTWWDLGDDAKTLGHQQVPRLIVMSASDNFTLYKITLKNAGFFHVTYSGGDGFTAWGVKIDTPQKAHNTDGIDPGSSKNITVTHSYIRDGDDNIAIKGGSGPVTNMTVIHNHFYYGHGMSIGSETQAGVSKLRVTDLSLDGTDSGIRIKSQEAYGGLVHDVVYDDICIRNSRNPILLDTAYSANPKPGKGLIPVFQDIDFHNVRISGGGRIALNGFDATHRIGVQFDGVVLTDGLSGYKFFANHADITLGPGPVNFHMAGEDSTERGKAAKGDMESCKDKFVPFPAE
jgi:polygalacturonase